MILCIVHPALLLACSLALLWTTPSTFPGVGCNTCIWFGSQPAHSQTVQATLHQVKEGAES